MKTYIAMEYTKQTWYRVYFSDFIANFGALAITVMNIFKLFMLWQH